MIEERITSRTRWYEEVKLVRNDGSMHLVDVQMRSDYYWEPYIAESETGPASGGHWCLVGGEVLAVRLWTPAGTPVEFPAAWAAREFVGLPLAVSVREQMEALDQCDK